MRAFGIGAAGVVCAMLLCANALALDFRGSIDTDVRFAPEDEWTIDFLELELSTEISGELHDRFAILVEPRLISHPIKDEMTLSDLQSRSTADAIELELGEAYGELRSLLLKGLDLKIGRQRIAWGTADKFNPTDNLNPDDMSDALDFGEKMPSLGISATYYFDSSRLELVWLPVFSPAVLPPLTEEMQQEFTEQMDMEPNTGSAVIDDLLNSMIAAEDISALSINQKSKLPDAKLENSTAAVKFATMLADFDLSLSYVYGFDDIGTPKLVEVRMSEDWEPNITAYMGYPRLHIIGADTAGALSWLGDVGVWAEAAYFIPEPMEFKALAYVPDEILEIARIAGAKVEEGALVVSEDEVADEPYFKATVGCDYTFKNDIYINIQYARGMPYENTPDMIGDYLIARAERSFMHETIKLAFNTIWSSGDGGWGLIPALEYYPFDGAELDISYFYPLGSEDSKIKRMSDPLLVFKAKLSF